MFENYSNIYKDSNKYANYGISQQEKKYLNKAKQQNKQNKYGLSSFSNSTINNHIGGLDSNTNIEAFGGMNQQPFLERFQNQQPGQTTQTMQSPQTLSGMNFGSPPPNPYPTNPSNSQNVSIQQINNQIQSLNNQNKLQAYNPKNPSNNLTTYSTQSEAVISQNQLTDAEIAELVGLTIQYNQLINQYNNAQTSVMSNADNQVLSMNSTTNPYLGQNLEISGGQVYYITNAGIAQPYDISPTQLQYLPSDDFINAGLLNAYSQITNTPSTVNSTSAINATVYDSAGTGYINTTPAMQIGNTKYQWTSSGYEGTNVYTNNSQPLSFTDASFQGCFNATISNGQQSVMSLAPGGLGGNYTFQTCQQVAYDSGSQFFSFNVSSPTSQTGNCYLSNSESPITQQGPALNYTYTQLWSSNITNVNNSDMSGNYMGIDPLGNIVIYNSLNSAIWSSDGSLNSGVSNFVGCYQDTIDVTQYNDVRNPINVLSNSVDTWESCYQTAYNQGYPYFGVGPYNPSTSTTTCHVSTDLSNIIAGGGSPNSCQNQIDGINYGSNGSFAVYSSTTAPLNTFLTLQNSGIVSAFNGTSLFDAQNVTWQLDMSGQQQMSNYYIITTATYSGYMQTGQTLQNGQTFCSPSANIFFTMQGGNLVLYTSSNTPKCYGMTNNQNQRYYAGDISMNALYQMSIPTNQFEITPRSNPDYLGNIGYVDENSVLYQYPQNLVGQGNTFTYMGNYDSSGIPFSNGNIYFAGLDLSGAMQQCIDFSCNAFVFYNTDGLTLTKYMLTAFGTPTYSQSSSNYLPRFPNPNAQFYLRNPTVNNSPYCNKSITGINTGLSSNYQTNGQMNTNMQCVQITTTDPQLKALGQQINNLSGQISTMQTKLMKKTMTVNQQQQLNEIVLGRQFKEIDAVQAVQKQSKQNAVNAQNIKNDSNIVVLRENQSYTLWSVLAISIALISIHVIR
jgi:hypothetical protein